MAKKLFFIAGESSGDLHGAHLIDSLLSLDATIETYGIGGSQMKKAGAEIFEDLTNVAVIGFAEVIKNLKFFKTTFNLALHKIDQIKPDAVILIDYPGFNLKIAAEIKKKNIPVIYYISPQVWAWGKKRIELIKKVVDVIIVFFKFEQILYEKNNMNVVFHGHPLIDIVKSSDYKESILQNHNIDKSKKIISLLPGSRINEVKRMLPVMLGSVSMIHNKDKNTQFLIIKSANIDNQIYEKIMDIKNLPVRLIESDSYDLLSISDFAIVCSGTATLETAILQIPMLVIYKIGFLSWILIKNLIKIPNVSLVNIVAGKKIVPEFLQYEIRGKKIAEHVLNVLNDKNKINKIKSDLKNVTNSLGNPGASNRTAEYILSFLSNLKS
ncbi:MAG: lipid-A-disaccharide synthase [Candidatus Kappaea frigidicola]|nr:lipid-A-disaccharide synthase [Candidatus Kappaea frigidicola]